MEIIEKILLDTNAYSKLLEQDMEIFSIISEVTLVYMPSVVVGELISGFYGGNQFEKNRKILKEFIGDLDIQILSIGFETAQIYGEIKNELRKNGTPIPVNDVWIAASTMETGAVLITYDKHFLKIPGLRTWYHLKEL